MMREQAMTVANDAALIDMMRQAQRRLIVLAPGLTMAVAQVLAEQWQLLGPDRVFVTLDVDAEVCRLGLGEMAAVSLLEEVAHTLGTTLNMQPGLRLGVIIADDQTLIYAPTMACVQASPDDDEGRAVQPNAVRIGRPPDDLQREVGAGPEGVREQVIGLDKADRATIKAVNEDLTQCPPQTFDLSRRLRVFTTHLLFVELRLTGCMIARRTVSIPSDLIGLTSPETQKLLENKFRLIAADDAGAWGQEVQRIKDFIVRRYLTPLPRFGQVIRTRDRKKFDLAVHTLRKFMARAKHRKRKSLQAAINRHIAALHAALLPAVRANPPNRWQKKLFTQSPEQLLDRELTKLVGDADTLLDQARVELRFKGVTYDMLQDQDFIVAVKRAMPDLKQLHLEFDAVQTR